MTLLSAYKVLLHRYSGQQDICVGTSIAGRQQQELEGLIGFFLNTLALRTEVSGDDSFIDLLQKVKTTTIEAYEHQELSFEKVVDAVVKERDNSRSPLFQVVFVLQNTPDAPRLSFAGLELSSERFDSNTSKFELIFTVSETGIRTSWFGTIFYRSL
jgi:non-ribosomal peptide synthetase component F